LTQKEESRTGKRRKYSRRGGVKRENIPSARSHERFGTENLPLGHHQAAEADGQPDF
jgi:hypothetical protein